MVRNQFVFIGRITKDIETKVGNTTIAKFSLAVDKMKKEDGTNFFNCTAFGKTAENIDKYFKKGDKIAVSGEVSTGSYEKDGKKIYTTDFLVNSFEFMNTKSEAPAETPAEETPSFFDCDDAPFN